MSGNVYPDLSTRLEAIKDAVSWAAGVNTVWRDQNDGGIVRRGNTPWVELRPRRLQKIGQDEIRHIDLETPTTEGTLDWPRQELIVAQREIFFMALFKSRSQEHVSSAWYAAARMQTMLNSTFLREKWLIGNMLSIIGVGDVQNMPETRVFQDRREDIAIIEFSIGATLCEEDAASVGSWIDRVLVTSNIKRGDTPLDSSIQLDDDVMGWADAVHVVDSEGNFAVDSNGVFVTRS